MLKKSLIEAGVKLNEFDIVPFPVERPERLANYVPLDATFYLTIYDQWGEHKKKILTELGVRVDVMWVRTMEQRLTSGTEIRDLVIKNDVRWKQLVPHAVAEYIEKNNLRQRLLQMNRKEK